MKLVVDRIKIKEIIRDTKVNENKLDNNSDLTSNEDTNTADEPTKQLMD
ncbi:MAG: hypothetical protein LBF68_06740 [Christensenellaceae bacterium]|jgi:hypothetical protein|nr:hypothetical protein [Christensenellaceae bacterium]